jgi:hypothetical protein
MRSNGSRNDEDKQEEEQEKMELEGKTKENARKMYI